MRIPTKGLSKNWRFEKSNKPDMGSYKCEEVFENVSTMRRSPALKFSKNPNNRFTTQIAKSKSYIPGAGNYNVDDCFKKLSRPPSAGRRRR
mmetsp:Transcript_11190/g.18812  ORF Transcript_11190/g.18812 Transcript_11190/m.18812 type:complete len:91 (-) Transcript_11190:63-335(-)